MKFNTHILDTWYKNSQKTIFSYLFSIKTEFQLKFTVHAVAEKSGTNLVLPLGNLINLHIHETNSPNLNQNQPKNVLDSF